jgi:hypothetical protein
MSLDSEGAKLTKAIRKSLPAKGMGGAWCPLLQGRQPARYTSTSLYLPYASAIR